VTSQAQRTGHPSLRQGLPLRQPRLRSGASAKLPSRPPWGAAEMPPTTPSPRASCHLRD
jgi:hypothetical protein